MGIRLLQVLAPGASGLFVNVTIPRALHYNFSAL